LRILIATQYFIPEITAGANRVHAFASGLTARGHEVEVLCEVPSHPAGIVEPGYGRRFVDRREMDGFTVNYVWVRTSPSKARRVRIENYGSYAATATLVGAGKRGVDTVIASSPPLPVGMVGASLALRHRVPWILDVRDVWPDLALVVGEVTETSTLLRLARRLEHSLYRSATAITTTSEGFAKKIAGRGGGEKVTLIPNGTTEVFLEEGRRPADRSAVDDSEEFVWTHAGNLGLVHGLDAAVGAAGELGAGFRLLLLGEGPRRAALQRMAEEAPEANVAFRRPVPVAECAKVMRASDALLVSVSGMRGLEATVASKLYDCCAVGRPVIVAAEGETRRLAEEAEIALCLPPDDVQALASAVRELRESPELRERLASRARAFAEANSRERGVETLARVLDRTHG
jgi:putative colanic acid biosynthesis glycosyltransferase WcaI